MFTDLQFAYVAGDMLFGCVWLLLYLRRSDVHREMILVGSIMGLISIGVAPLFADYWQPTYIHPLRIEEFLYGFFAGGIASGIYEVLYGKRISRKRDTTHHWIILGAGLVIAAGISFMILLDAGVLSVYASGALLLLCGAFTLLFRRDLVRDALFSGVLFAALTAILFWFYIVLFPSVIHTWWSVEQLTLVDFIGYPLEEVVWAFCLGFYAGPLYEFLAGRRFAR